MTNSNDSKPVGLIQGLAYTVPTSGVIRIGYTKAGNNGKRLPVKDDEFRITTKVKDRDTGDWQRHPLDAELRSKYGVDVQTGQGKPPRKLREIPVTVVFDRPELNMAEQYAAFSPEGIPLCVGDGSKAKRRQQDGSVTDETCPGSRYCKYGETARCDAFLRLLVRVEGQPETAPPMILRTGSVNAVTDNRATLEHWASMYGGRLAGLPFKFVLDAKQTAMSRQSVFYFGRLEPNFKTIAEGAQILNAARAQDAELGINRAAAEQKLVDLRSNGAFAEDTDDGSAQFDDLIVGRFTEEVEGGQREITIGASASTAAALQSPREAAAGAVLELSTRLAASRGATATAAAAS